MGDNKKFVYEYKRTFNKEIGLFDIDGKPLIEENAVRVAKEIQTALHGTWFIVRCDNEICNVIFDEELSSEKKKILDKVIEDHKKNN